MMNGGKMKEGKEAKTESKRIRRRGERQVGGNKSRGNEGWNT